MVLGIGGLVSAVSALNLDNGARDNDMVDRLNHMVMSALLLCLAIASGSRQYVGTAIYCWAPAEFSQKYHRRYINQYCWANVVYNVPFDDSVAPLEGDRYDNDVSYYKLATVLFLLLAVLFVTPHFVWRSLRHVSAENLPELIELTTQSSSMDQDQKDKQLGRVAELFHKWISSFQLSTLNGSHFCPREILTIDRIRSYRSGHRLVAAFLLVKCLYLINVIGQFFIISAFLQTNFWTLGPAAVVSYFKFGQWEDTYNFPRVVHCDFKIRQMENVHTYTVQCVLAINAFLEKMFLLLWICLMIMLISNALSCIKWMFELCLSHRKASFLEKHVDLFMTGRPATYEDRRDVIIKLKRYLQVDGVFVLRMIAINTSDMLTSDLVKHIWTKYSRSHNDDTSEADEDTIKNYSCGPSDV